MEEQYLELPNSFRTKITELKAIPSYRPVPIRFPSLIMTITQKLSRYSAKIDRCVIEYMPQIPINSTGTVRIVVLDNRLYGEDQIQAEYAIPVTCKCEIIYHGNSFTSMNETHCPWTVRYKLQDSNINPSTFFAKIVAHLKLTTEKRPEDVPYKPSGVNILTPRFGIEDIDVWDVGPKKIEPVMCRSLTLAENGIRYVQPHTRALTFQESRRSLSEKKTQIWDKEEANKNNQEMNNTQQHKQSHGHGLARYGIAATERPFPRSFT
jgi:hypothetical protein